MDNNDSQNSGKFINYDIAGLGDPSKIKKPDKKKKIIFLCCLVFLIGFAGYLVYANVIVKSRNKKIMDEYEEYDASFEIEEEGPITKSVVKGVTHTVSNNIIYSSNAINEKTGGIIYSDNTNIFEDEPLIVIDYGNGTSSGITTDESGTVINSTTGESVTEPVVSDTTEDDLTGENSLITSNKSNTINGVTGSSGKSNSNSPSSVTGSSGKSNSNSPSSVTGSSGKNNSNSNKSNSNSNSNSNKSNSNSNKSNSNSNKTTSSGKTTSSSKTTSSGKSTSSLSASRNLSAKMTIENIKMLLRKIFLHS